MRQVKIGVDNALFESERTLPGFKAFSVVAMENNDGDIQVNVNTFGFEVPLRGAQITNGVSTLKVTGSDIDAKTAQWMAHLFFGFYGFQTGRDVKEIGWFFANEIGRVCDMTPKLLHEIVK